MYYDNFEKLCARDGVRPSTVSKETGISSATLTSWKKGAYTPKNDKLQLIADYFNVSLEYLLGSDGYSYEEDTKTWIYNIPKQDMQIFVEVMSDDNYSKRLIAYAKKLLELKNMEDL